MARRGDEAQAEPLEIVEGVAQRVDLELAAVAGAGIDLADREAAPEARTRRTVDRVSELGERHLIARGRRFGQRHLEQAFQEQLAHHISPA